MLALEEKARTVALLAPSVLMMDGKVPEIVTKLDAAYLEIKMRKQQYMTEADAEAFFNYLPPAEMAASVSIMTQGLSEVLVLEHIDGNVVDRALELRLQLEAELGPGLVYTSACEWSAARDLEYLFPHLDQMPVERTLAVVKADGIARGSIGGETLEEVVEREAGTMGLVVVGKRKLLPPHHPLKPVEIELLCAHLKDPNQEGTTADYKNAMGVVNGPEGAVVMCLEGRGAIGKWSLRCGPQNSGVARERAPKSLRARWGTDGTSNAIHNSATFEDADTEIITFFPDGTRSLQRTLCIVKPDAMPNLLHIRAELEAAGFTILKEKECVLTQARAEEFYRDHKGKPHFAALVEEATSGPCAIMALCRLEAVSVLKQVMGPEVVRDAKRLRPKSLRAKFGRDGQRNAVHGSDSLKSAGREVRFFFPELGADPIPGDDEVRDFLFRKSAGASMDLKTLSEADAASFNVDPTLQQLLSKGLMALCQVQPQGLAAVKWLSRWLDENNPNKKTDDAAVVKRADSGFEPPERIKRFIEYGVNPEGMPFAVEPPVAGSKKQIVDMDVEAGGEGAAPIADIDAPPFVIFLLGGPGSGKDALCARLCKDFNFVQLSIDFLMQEEKNAGTYLGTSIDKALRSGQPVPDDQQIKLLKAAIAKHKDTNRFLLDGFPTSAQQAILFEQQVSSCSFILYLQCSDETMKARVQKDDETRVPAGIDKDIKDFNQHASTMLEFYGPIGKVRKVDANQEMEEVYGEAKRYFGCRFVYLLAPPGSPTVPVASKICEKYGYACINMTSLLEGYANSKERDAAKVQETLAKGRPVDASIACPLVLAEVYRELALGVQNFVMVDFPQSLKQVQFLEHRIHTIDSRPLLVDFSRPDAEDLAAMSGAASGDSDSRMAYFFGGEMQAMFQEFPNLVRIPCSLSEVSQGGEAAVVQQVLPKVLERVMPSLTLVLGLPCSGTTELAERLAALTPNTQAVDCSKLIDSELERQTEVGVAMSAMLAKGQVVPLSMTLELLKDIVNTTCSNSLVIENCPLYIDQVEYLEKEFRIDRVFYIKGTDKAVHEWREAYINRPGTEDATSAARAFVEREERLEPIVSYFSRLGKLDRIDVNDKPKPSKLESEIRAATTPQFALITGLSSEETPKQAKMLADYFGAGPPVTPEMITEFAKTKLQRSLEPDDMTFYFSALKKYADSMGLSVLVLDRFPKVADRSPKAPPPETQAEQFVKHFGVKVVLNMEFEAATLTEEINALATANEEDPPDAEALEEKVAADMKAYGELLACFNKACPSACITVDWAKVSVAAVPDGDDPLPEKTHEEIFKKVKERLRPQIYNIVAPAGAADIAGKVANGISTMRQEGKSAASQKVITLDARHLMAMGPHHSRAISDRLHKATFTGDCPEAMPLPLMKDLFAEAFAKSASPMGTFLVTDYITPTSVGQGHPIRDQFCLLEDVAMFKGIVNVKLGEKAFHTLVSGDQNEWLKYQAFKEHVDSTMQDQFFAQQICECFIDEADDMGAVVKKVADSFATFRERVESLPTPAEEAAERMAKIREVKVEEDDAE